MSILSGMTRFGLDNLENASVIMEEKSNVVNAAEPVRPPEFQEIDLIFDKNQVCPVCGSEFKVKAIRMGKTRLIGTDLDLRPKYDPVDSMKYDVFLCPICGYAALSRYFKFVTGAQSQLIRDNISMNFRAPDLKFGVIDYDEAIDRYKLALANAIVKRSKPSERGYICLKMAWVIRGKAEKLDQTAESCQEEQRKCKESEEELLHNAMECFLAARQREGFPMCGMDEATVDYLLSVMSYRFGHKDVALKLLGSLLVSKVNSRMKDKARTLKDMILADAKKQRSK